MTEIRRGRPRKANPNPRAIRRQFKFTENNIADAEFVRAHYDLSSEAEAVRKSVRYARRGIELAQTTGLYTKKGDEFVQVTFI